MTIREVCGNNYGETFEIVRTTRSHGLGSPGWAVHAFAPTCVHCECRIGELGLEADGIFFCCVNCAKHYGVQAWKNRMPCASA